MEEKTNPFSFQNVLTNTMKAKRAEEMKTSIQLTLGELILKLEAIGKNLPIYFDNKKYRPTGIESWRGSYCELSINYEGGGNINSTEIEKVHKFKSGDHTEYKSIDTALPKNVKVKDLLSMLKISIGKTMTGYKGGDFLIGKTTPVWVSRYGQSSGYKKNKNYDSQAIVDVEVKEKKAILKTKMMSY